MARSRASKIFIQSLLLSALALGWLIGDHLHGTRRYWRTPSDPANGFLVSPYLQLGSGPHGPERESVEVLWHTFEPDDERRSLADASSLEPDWSVSYRSVGETRWRSAESAPTFRAVAVPGVYPHRVYRATIDGLTPGIGFEYRVEREGRTRFQAAARARPAVGEPARTVIFGDFGNGSKDEARVAHRVWEERPDTVVLAGDLVYWRGRIGEYEDYFFPFYNAERPDRSVGAPLLRSMVVFAAPGNHDLTAVDLDEDPDAQAFFYYWSFPLNGPAASDESPGSPMVEGSPERLARFREAAGPAYPRMANYSVDVGDIHWTMIDLNPYVDWHAPELRAWLEADLEAARDKPWRLVVGHQPGFQSGRAHCHEQQMRQLAPIFERGGVSVVFAGHVHNYQRSLPLRFQPKRRGNGRFNNGMGHIDGVFSIDRSFDGAGNTLPDGVIYLVTGGGGASLHDTERDERVPYEFTVSFIADRHSITVMDSSPDRLGFRQVDADGEVIDRFVIERAPSRVVNGQSTEKSGD